MDVSKALIPYLKARRIRRTGPALLKVLSVKYWLENCPAPSIKAGIGNDPGRFVCFNQSADGM